MATPTYSISEQIEQSRQQIAEAKAEAQRQAKAIRLPKRDIKWQLQNKEFAMSGRVESEATKRKSIGQGMVAGVLGREAAFESEVSQLAPEYAQPVYLEKAYQEASSSISPQMESLRSTIAYLESKKENLKKDKNYEENLDNLNKELAQDRAELRVYETAAGNKQQLVKQYFSGELSARGDYAREGKRYQAESKQEQTKLAKSLGLSLDELKEKFSDVETGTKLETVFSEPQILKLEQAKIIKYDKVVTPKEEAGGYFVNAQGQGFSSQIDMPGMTKTATMSEVKSGRVLQQNNLWYGQDSVKGFTFEQTPAKENVFGVSSSLGMSYSPSNQVAINEKTGKPFGEVRPLTKEESFFYKIGKSKPYKVFERLWEPVAIVGTAAGGFASTLPAIVLKPFFEAGRKGEDTSISAKVYRGGLMTAKTAAVFSNPYTGTAGSLYFGGEAISSFAQSPLGFIQGTYKYIKSEPLEFAGGLAGAKIGKVVGETSFFGKKPIKITPTLEMEKAVQPFSRQRATVLLKTSSGDYLMGKTKSGEIISIGGGIEKGQTARVAALAELKQETGLTLKDISGFKSAGKVVFPEETFKLFTATLNKGVKIKAASDIKSIVKVSPSNLFLRGSTGQTALQPISRYVPFKGRVRAYEAGIMNFMETGVKPTWLLAETKGGGFILGTQSRYNVPYKSQKQYLKQEELLLAHGTPQPAVLKRWSLFNKKFPIEASKTKRGLAQGLYVQPPISPGSEGYIGLSYLNIGKSNSGGLGLKVNYPKRTAYIFRESPTKLKPTPKTFSGIESEFIIPPESTVATSARAEVFSIGLKKVYIQPSKIEGSSLKGVSITGKTIASISSEGQYKYVTPGEVISPLIKQSSTQIKKETIKKETSSILKEVKVYSTESYSKPLKQTKSIIAEITRPREKPYNFKEYKEPIKREPKYNYNPGKYPEPIKPYKYPPYNPKRNPPIAARFMKQGRGKKKLFSSITTRKPYKQTIYTPSIGASILRLTTRSKPKALIGQTSYAPGFRPTVIKGDGKILWKKKSSLKI